MTNAEQTAPADQLEPQPAAAQDEPRPASLLQRIIIHLRNQHWTAIGLEFVVVVFGVFLAFQLNNWNSDRIAQEAGQNYRARIVADARNNEADLQGRAAYFEQVKAFGLQVLGDLDGSAPIGDETFLIAAYQATQIYTRPLVRATYDEILSTGAINTLGDAPTRDRTANYYLGLVATEIAFATTTAYRDVVRSAMPYQVQVRVRTQCAEVLGSSTIGTPLGRLVLPEACDLDLSEDDLAKAATRVRATPGLEQAVTRLLADLDQKLTQASRAQERVTALLKDLSALP
jgi:hypothetical protein